MNPQAEFCVCVNIPRVRQAHVTLTGGVLCTVNCHFRDSWAWRIHQKTERNQLSEQQEALMFLAGV